MTTWWARPTTHREGSQPICSSVVRASAVLWEGQWQTGQLAPLCDTLYIIFGLHYLFGRLGEHPGFAGHAREVGTVPVRKPVVSLGRFGRRLAYVVSDLDALLQDAAQVARTAAPAEAHISL